MLYLNLFSIYSVSIVSLEALYKLSLDAKRNKISKVISKPRATYLLGDTPYSFVYALTKPFHHSQEVLERLPDGSVIIKVKVHLNFEFDRLILGFGDSIEILKPRILRNRIKRRLINAAKHYEKIKNETTT